MKPAAVQIAKATAESILAGHPAEASTAIGPLATVPLADTLGAPLIDCNVEVEGELEHLVAQAARDGLREIDAALKSATGGLRKAIALAYYAGLRKKDVVELGDTTPSDAKVRSARAFAA